jgi:hypothetical protein
MFAGFGSATLMTAASIGGINQLYERFRGDDIEFLFVYVREAHPGESFHAQLHPRKTEAARLLRDEEDMHMPILVDDLRGSIPRKYSKLPNPAFLIDKSGRVAFLSLWSRPAGLGHAIQELLDLQEERGVDRAVVKGGQDLEMPVPYSALYAYRALERGGKQSLADFRHALGLPARVALTASHLARPLLDNPGRIMSIAALTAAVLAGGLCAGTKAVHMTPARIARRKPLSALTKEQKLRDTGTGTHYGSRGDLI